MAADRRHPQPRKAPQPPDSSSSQLTRTITGRPTSPAGPRVDRRHRQTFPDSLAHDRVRIAGGGGLGSEAWFVL
jgi:hypothetical protein